MRAKQRQNSFGLCPSICGKASLFRYRASQDSSGCAVGGKAASSKRPVPEKAELFRKLGGRAAGLINK
jgi:hypothetical protein